MKKNTHFGLENMSRSNEDSGLSLDNVAGDWKIKINEVGIINLPERLGKVLSLGIGMNNFTRVKEKFNCHQFVGLGLGMISVKDIKGNNDSNVLAKYRPPNLFSEEDFKDVDNVSAFNQLVREELGDEKIGVFQLLDSSNEITHSSFVFSLGDEVVIIAKSGMREGVIFSRNDEVMQKCIDALGSKVAIGRYSKFARHNEGGNTS